LAMATLLLVIAFMNEPRNGDMKTPYTHMGVYAILLGIASHWLSGLKQKKSKDF
jgi:hypothetical protein